MSPMVQEPLTVEHALLGYLHRQPMYGYEIYQAMSRRSGAGLVWRVKQSQLYALLERLERGGHITASIEHQETRPPRKVFHITPQGEQAYQAWVSEPVSQPRGMRIDFLAKLYFVTLEPPPLAQQLIDRQREICRQWLETLSRRRSSAPGEPAYDSLVWSYRIHQVQACQDWLDDCQKSIALNAKPG